MPWCCIFISKQDQSNCSLYLFNHFLGGGNQTWQQLRINLGDDVDIIQEEGSTRGNIFSQMFRYSRRELGSQHRKEHRKQITMNLELLPRIFLFTRPEKEGSSLRQLYAYLLLDVSTLFFSFERTDIHQHQERKKEKKGGSRMTCQECGW